MVEIRSVTVMEEGESMMLEPGAVVQSLRELRDIFFGDSPLLRYELKVPAPTERAAEVKARGFVRAKNPFALQRLVVGRVRKIPGSGTRGDYIVTINVRG